MKPKTSGKAVVPDKRYADYLVCYDIREPRRLRRVHRCMREWGTPIQYSVFLCRLSAGMRTRMVRELRERIDERVDDVRIYTIQSGATIQFQGRPPVPDGLVMPGLQLSGVDNDSQQSKPLLFG